MLLDDAAFFRRRPSYDVVGCAFLPRRQMDPPPPKRARVLSAADWAPVLAAAEPFRQLPAGAYELELSRLTLAHFGPTAFGPSPMPMPGILVPRPQRPRPSTLCRRHSHRL